jgi:hypothetical protein
LPDAALERASRWLSRAWLDRSTVPITKPDAEWAVEKAIAALGGVKALLSAARRDRSASPSRGRA